jgi:hypothetical protein
MGAGVCNFPNVEAATAFAQELADLVEEYELDGIDIDDEYAQYGDNGTGQPNQFSFLYLIRELRQLLPSEKLITFYYYGPAAQRLAYENQVAGMYLSYSWNAIYGTYYPPDIPGWEGDRTRVGPAAINVRGTSESTSSDLARRTIDDGYGVFLCYALPNNDESQYMSAITRKLYGSETQVREGCLRDGLKDHARNTNKEASCRSVGCKCNYKCLD